MRYYYIYEITNLLNGMRYRGQHQTDNLDDGYMGSSRYLSRAIKKHGKECFRKEILTFCEDAEELDYMERVYVDQTWVDRSDTYNFMTGGYCGLKSDETKRRMTAAQRKYYGSVESIPTRKKIGDANRGRKHTLKDKLKMWVPVCQYTKDGKLIAEYKSLSEAEEKTGVLHNNISKVCTGKRPYAGGCVWKYKQTDGKTAI